MEHLSRKNNFTYLFIALLLFLFTAAIVAQFSNHFSKGSLIIITLVMIATSIRSIRTDLSWKHTVHILLPVFFILSITEYIFNDKISLFLMFGTLLVFFAGSFHAAFRQILFEGDIDKNKLIGSLTLYLLIGLIWAVIYLLILVIDPSAFSGLEVTSWQEGFSRIAYYSFVTLTTLGYGDILPKNHIAEFFVYMEAIIGVFYMAIIVSSLISLRLAAIQEARKGR
jgi:hypothetical protein